MRAKSGTMIGFLICLLPLIGQAQESQFITNPMWYANLASYKNYDKTLPDLKVGEILPDFKINKIVNSAKVTASSSDFKDKLLIIDLWNRGCSTCIAMFPHMESLQKQFGDRIKVLPVDDESEKDIKKFWKVNPIARKTSLPSVVEDRTFRSYFKYYGVPQHVWIYKEKVIAITYPDYATPENIEKVLNGEKIDWGVKSDFFGFDLGHHSLLNVGVDPANPQKSYAISSFKEKDGKSYSGSHFSGSSGIIRDSVNKTIRVGFVNMSIPVIYCNCLNASPNDVVFKVADLSKYIYPRTPGSNSIEWTRKNAICFEAIYADKGQSDEEVKKQAAGQLSELLGLKMTKEGEKYVITEKDNKTEPKLSN